MSDIVENARRCVAAWRSINMIGVADMVDGLLAEIARLRLTDAEREAVGFFATLVRGSTLACGNTGHVREYVVTLRGLLKRIDP